MPARSVPCPSCGRRVASGRTECAACGADVASSTPTFAMVPVAADPADGRTTSSGSRPRRPKAAVIPEPGDPVAVAPADHAAPAPLPDAERAASEEADPGSRPVDADLAALLASASTARRDADAILEPSLGAVPPPDPVRRAGAYLPPSTSATGSRGPALAVAGSAARPFATPAPTWIDRRPLVPDAATAAAVATNGGTPVPARMQSALGAVSAGATGRQATTTRASAPDDEAVVPGRASVFADLPFDAPDDLAGWLVAIGSIGAVLSFVFPWAPEVLGSPSLGTSYFSQWGLASPMHIPPLLFIVGIAALAVLPNAVPTWLRTGILPVLAGGLLLGLTWPYLVGGFGGLLGTTFAAAAAILMVMGGGVELAPRREVARDQ